MAEAWVLLGLGRLLADGSQLISSGRTHEGEKKQNNSHEHKPHGFIHGVQQPQANWKSVQAAENRCNVRYSLVLLSKRSIYLLPGQNTILCYCYYSVKKNDSMESVILLWSEPPLFERDF